jgi:hypothetical protein
MTTIIQASFLRGGPDAGAGLCLTTVRKNKRKPHNSKAAETGSNPRHSQAVMLTAHRKETPTIHNPKDSHPLETANVGKFPIFESE